MLSYHSANMKNPVLIFFFIVSSSSEQGISPRGNESKTQLTFLTGKLNLQGYSLLKNEHSYPTFVWAEVYCRPSLGKCLGKYFVTWCFYSSLINHKLFFIISNNDEQLSKIPCVSLNVIYGSIRKLLYFKSAPIYLCLHHVGMK